MNSGFLILNKLAGGNRKVGEAQLGSSNGWLCGKYPKMLPTSTLGK